LHLGFARERSTRGFLVSHNTVSQAQHVARELRVERDCSKSCVPYVFGLSPSHPSRSTRGISARLACWILDLVRHELGINILTE
jgi:hypothetical protein